MTQLNRHLPPYSSDFTGALSIMFELGGLSIIHDAACCTRCYTDYEEPRWNRRRNFSFCSQLRTVDAILGNDEKLISLAIEASKELSPPFIAILGTPVPSIIGTDMNGIAREIEEKTGIKALGLNTNGFDSYEKGIEMAIELLIEAFAKKSLYPHKPGDKTSVNFVGLTPLDFYDLDYHESLRKLFEDNGFICNCSFGMGYSISNIENFFKADVNIALTTSSLRACQRIYKKYNMPYLYCCPMAKSKKTKLFEAVRLCANESLPTIIGKEDAQGQNENEEILIVWEQGLAQGLRHELREKGSRANITVASFGEMDEDVASPSDIALSSEKHLINLLATKKFNKLVADRLILGLPQIPGETKKLEICHPALSSNLFLDKKINFLSKEFDQLIENIII